MAMQVMGASGAMKMPIEDIGAPTPPAPDVRTLLFSLRPSGLADHFAHICLHQSSISYRDGGALLHDGSFDAGAGQLFTEMLRDLLGGGEFGAVVLRKGQMAHAPGMRRDTQGLLQSCAGILL